MYRGWLRLGLAPGFRTCRSRIRMYLKDPLSRWTSWTGLAALELSDSAGTEALPAGASWVSAVEVVIAGLRGSIIQESIMRLAWASKPGSEKSSLPGANAPAKKKNAIRS